MGRCFNPVAEIQMKETFVVCMTTIYDLRLYYHNQAVSCQAFIAKASFQSQESLCWVRGRQVAMGQLYLGSALLLTLPFPQHCHSYVNQKDGKQIQTADIKLLDNLTGYM